MDCEYLNEIKICKYCGKPVKYGDMIWLNSKCMCPACYKEARGKGE